MCTLKSIQATDLLEKPGAEKVCTYMRLFIVLEARIEDGLS